MKDDVDKDKKRAATQAAFKRKFKKNSDFWVYEKKIRLVIRKAIKQQWFYWTVIVLGNLMNKPKMAYSCDLADMDFHGLSWTIIDYHRLSKIS